MIENLKKLENLINSELTSKIQSSFIANDELSIEINENDLIEIIQFLKSNEKCKFRQLIDIAGVDYPNEEKRFKLVYLFLSHENNCRIKISINFQPKQIINSITKIFPAANNESLSDSSLALVFLSMFILYTLHTGPLSKISLIFIILNPVSLSKFIIDL